MTYAHRPKSVAPNTIATLDSMSQIVETLISKKQRPQSLTLESKKVVISDVHGDLDRFDIALEIVAANDWPWPCARIDVGSSRQEPGLEHKRLVPIDLAEGFEDTFGETVSELIHRRIFEERSGFGTWGVQIEPVPPTQIKSVFARGLADFIRERWKSLRNTPDDSGGHSPPETAVAVTTTIDKQTVLFSKGFFLSTRQGFGISSPAVRVLSHGVYLFGIDRAGTSDFDETLWSIPQVIAVHLRKP